jgi:hypothetical protein
MPTQNFNQASNTPSTRRRTTSTGVGQEAFQGSSQGNDRRATGASTLTSQVQGVLDQQVVKGAKMMSNVANSTRRAADELQIDAPQLAGLVRGMADRLQDYSRNLEEQSVSDIYRTASDFTRRQPAVVFGLAALAGFFVLRTIKSSSTSMPAQGSRVSTSQGGEFHGS